MLLKLNFQMSQLVFSKIAKIATTFLVRLKYTLKQHQMT